LNPSPSVIVVGGGVMGCAALYYLAELGTTDTLLLERDALGSGSTSRTQGVLRMHYSNQVTTRMAWESLAIYRDFNEHVGSPSGYVRTGYLLAVPADYGDALRRNVEMQTALGVETSVASRDDLSTLAPDVRTRHDEVYAFEPRSGYADGHLVTGGFARRAQELGAALRTGAAAHVGSIVIERGKVTGVRANGELIPTAAVVVAAGPWTGPLLAELGVDVPLATVRHQVLVVTRPPSLSHPTLGDVTNGFSGRMDAPGLSLVALGEDPDTAGPDRYNKGVDPAAMAAGMLALSTRVPGMSDAGFVRGWSGLLTVTPDWHPVIDRVEGIDGLYVAAGFSGHGFKMAPAIGRAVAEVVLGLDQAIDTGQLRLSRFEEGDLLGSSYPMQVLA
jgi:sarcosine oxidase subunit beta